MALLNLTHVSIALCLKGRKKQNKTKGNKETSALIGKQKERTVGWMVWGQGVCVSPAQGRLFLSLRLS